MQLALVLGFLLAFPLVVRVAGRLVRGEWERIAAQRTPPAPSAPPIERVTQDLRRLRYQMELRENRPGISVQGMKLGAVRAAYLEVLEVACRQLDVRPPRCHNGREPSLAELYRVESDLRRRGLDVRTPGFGSQAA